MLTGIHWYDVLIPLGMLALIAGGLVIVGRSIGPGYARARRRMERQQPEQP